jgi:hypothetical protein
MSLEIFNFERVGGIPRRPDKSGLLALGGAKSSLARICRRSLRNFLLKISSSLPPVRFPLLFAKT